MDNKIYQLQDEIEQRTHRESGLVQQIEKDKQAIEAYESNLKQLLPNSHQLMHFKIPLMSATKRSLHLTKR